MNPRSCRRHSGILPYVLPKTPCSPRSIEVPIGGGRSADRHPKKLPLSRAPSSPQPIPTEPTALGNAIPRAGSRRRTRCAARHRSRCDGPFRSESPRNGEAGPPPGNRAQVGQKIRRRESPSSAADRDGVPAASIRRAVPSDSPTALRLARGCQPASSTLGLPMPQAPPFPRGKPPRPTTRQSKSKDDDVDEAASWGVRLDKPARYDSYLYGVLHHS